MTTNLLEEIRATEDQYKTIAVSTIHLSEQDKARLTELADDKMCNMVLERDTGWFIKLYDETESNEHGVSDSLNLIFTVCLEAGFRMIEFDCDAQSYECLSTYE